MADANFIAPSIPSAAQGDGASRLAAQSSPVDRLVFRDEFMRVVDISTDTVIKWQKQGKLPPFDYAPTRKRQAWKRSTLIENGHFVPEILVPVR